MQQVKLIKSKNPKLAVLYSMLGRWKPSHLTLIRDSQQRKKFNQQVRDYLLANQLDGLGKIDRISLLFMLSID